MEEEVNEVIKEMHNGKAPGPYGFNIDFFKACCEIVKHDILEVVEDSRNSKTILKTRFDDEPHWLVRNASTNYFLCDFAEYSLNNVMDHRSLNSLILKTLNVSFIALIPKLKPLLPTLVSQEQTGYVERRKIINNIIQAHEVVHSLKNNKQAGMIIQLDLAKAYDKLIWSYIRDVLKAYGFDHNWIRWVMALVRSASFSILLNGSPSRTFWPLRGLRQGDPLSPFLFILMLEGLGKVINAAKAEGRI
eukprot:PITA_06840